MQKYLDDVARTYGRMQDSISKKIYTSRILYETTHDKKYLWDILLTLPAMNDFMRAMARHESQKKILFGAGLRGRWFESLFEQGTWHCFADNASHGKVNGLDVISFHELSEDYGDAFVVIDTRYSCEEIFSQLMMGGRNKDNIYNLGHVWNEIIDGQYFDLEALIHDDDEVFVDVGGFDGYSSLMFAKWAQDKYKHIYVFEPNIEVQNKCRDMLAGMNRWTLVPKGVWSSSQKLRFCHDEDAVQESKIIIDSVGTDVKETTEVPVVSLDDYFVDERVTFIKMDIEGAELEALKGAKGCICRWKPKLAISVYHNSEDILEIPELLLRYHSDYKFYMRHYSMTWQDTVLYAI